MRLDFALLLLKTCKESIIVQKLAVSQRRPRYPMKLANP
jgi:hypothetical protein